MRHSRFLKSAISALAGAVILSCSASAALADDEVTLTIAARGGSHVDVINAVKDKFEKENNCTIKILGLENASLKQKVSLDSRNEEGAFDLVMLDDPWIPEFAAGGLLLNLTQNGYKDDPDFVSTSLAVCKEPYASGDTYALPFAGNVTLLFYNEGVLNKVGAKVPDNWQDVLSISQKVKEQGLLGYLVRGQQGNPIVGDYLPILWALGGDVFDKDMKNVTVNSQIAKDALALYIELYKTDSAHTVCGFIRFKAVELGVLAYNFADFLFIVTTHAGTPSMVSSATLELLPQPVKAKTRKNAAISAKVFSIIVSVLFWKSAGIYRRDIQVKGIIP